MNIPKLDDFVKEIETLKREGQKMGENSIEIQSGVLHKMLGDFKGKDARMTSCCRAMYACMKTKDEIIQQPNPRNGNPETKGFGSRLIIRYYL